MERWQLPPSTLHATESSLDYNVPLRSVRGDGAAPSPFYKLSSELSQESLRIPGAVPFLWEQSPGRRKFAASAGALPAPSSAPLPPCPETASVEPTLAVLFRQPSLRVLAVPSPVSSAIPPIGRPPSADHPRSSSARYSVVQRGAPPLFVDNDYDAASDATSDALTATAGGLSVDDSFVSGAVRLSSTASDARDFIMHRFLPAAHAIACDSPQTPSRRFVPAAAAISLACASGVEARPSPALRGVSTPVTPGALARALPAPSPSPFMRSHHASLNSDDDDEDDDNEPPASTRACGMFTFRIRNALFHFRHRASSSRSKQQHKKSRQNGLVCSGPRRIIDILNEDASLNDVEDQQLPSKQLQQKLGKMGVTDRAMPPGKPLSIETYRASPFHQLIVQTHPFDESSTYYDVSSRFNSPAPVGATKAAEISSPCHAYHSMRFAQTASNYDLSLNNNTTNKPNPPYLASEISSNFNTSGESADAEQTALYYNDDNFQQKPHLNNANGHDEGIIKGINGPISISVNPVATSRSRLSVTQKWPESNNGDIYQASSPAALLSPPLPKSPTQSWLGRAIPTKCPSPLSRMHRAPPPKKENHPEDSKWEAIVKGSHVQPGHLRFSEELHHQSPNTTMNVGT